MRRTYRSKKETGGGMDPRDVVLAMDEKGSVFDAFYIESIKQTKRDLSVGASMFAASNKVRKRKYVKRLKDQEPIIRDTTESTSRSGYLTPDKSIHLKRELDPFDLLLNSSSTNEVPPKPSKINVFSGSPLYTRGKGRTYMKKAPCKKKFVYSSSEDTDSDKENSFNRSKSDETQNQSDVLSHKLEIEKEEKIVSNKIDESIINIVTDLSLFNNFNSASPLSSTMKDKLSIASVQKSPICSTPFHKKYRAKFMYKFSPISVDTNDSEHYTIAENLEESTENKNELNNIPNTTVQFAYPYNKSVDYDEINSPILPSRDVIDKNRTKMLKHHHPITKEISLLQTSEQEPFLGFPIKNSWSIPNINLEAVNFKYLEREENNLEVLQQNQYIDLPNENISSNLDNKNNQNSSLENDNDANLNPDTIENQLVLAKPLENLISPKLVCNTKSGDQLHFEDYKDHYNETEQSNVNRPEEEALSQSYLEKNSIVDNAHSLIKENTLESSQIRSAQNSIVEHEYSLNEENASKTSQIYSETGGTSSSDENKHVLNYEDSSEDEMEQNTLEPSQTRSEENSSIESEHSLVEESISGEEIEQNTSKQRTNSEENSTIENESSVTEQGTFDMSKDTESLYKSCNSENEISDIETDNKELLVVLERLNDSILVKKYYNKEANSIGDSSQRDEINNESCSSENSNNIYTSINEIDTLSESTKSTSNDNIEDDLQEDTLMNVSNIDQDVDFNEINKSDEDVFVSFVTRRRRNEITKDSFILSFDNSLTSTSSSDFNKTVLTNTKPSKNSLEGNNDITLSNDVQEPTDVVLVNKSQICDGDISLLQCENTIIETELSPLQKIKSAGVVTKKSAVISRQSSKLSAENFSRESGTTENDFNSRKSVASKMSTAKTRKSSKLLTDNINREFYSEINDSTSGNSVTCKKRAVKKLNTRKNSKLSTNEVDKESINEESDRTSGHIVASKKSAVTTRKSNKLSSDNNINKEFSKETNDYTSKNSFIVPGTNIMTRKSSRLYQESASTNCFAETLSPLKYDINPCHDTVNDMSEIKQGIVLEPGKRWERSLSIYRRVTTMADHFDQSMLDDEQLINKGRMYRQSVISTMEMQDTTVSLHNESVKSRRSTLFSKPSRSTIKILRESNVSRISLSSTSASEDLGFLSEDCDDTLVQLSKLSIIDSDHEVTVLDKFNDTSNRITTARDYVLRRCNQTDVIPFDECYPDTLLKNCRKIGEGVYGEVFLWRARDGRARVLKVVPIAGSTKVNGESQKDYHEIISEIVIAMELSALRAPIIEIEKHLDEGQGVETLDLHSVENATDVFNEVLAVRCVYGSYPSRLLDLWDLYDECKGSENDNPAILPADQQFMVLELANAGQDLESYQFHNAEQAFALFQQVAFGLAVAEEAFQFEHRDLHWGNVLIAPTDQKYATFVLRGRAHRVARRGVAATIIDYSLSRLSLRLPADTAALYNDLATDDGLFDAVGDYQFQVYRLMRDKLGNDWKNFEPYTNILWLHYTVDKMITALRYTRTNTKIHKHYIAKLKEIKNRILDYGSAVQYVLTDNEI